MKIYFAKSIVECSKRFCGSPEECCRCRLVLTGPRRERDIEALLVAVFGAGATSATEQSDDAAGGAP